MVFGCGPKKALPRKIRKEDLEELVTKTKLKPREIKALYSRFRRLAHAGFLSQIEFKQTMGVLGMTDDPFLPERMFRVFDVDQDGKLSFLEFASSLAIMIRGSEDEKLKLSFEMTAGKPGAMGISLGDFQRLVQAAKAMMSSLLSSPLEGLESDEEIQRLFHDILADGNGAAGKEGGFSDQEGDEAVITMDKYKSAAQSNDDFLACLGIVPVSKKGAKGTPRRSKLQTLQGALNANLSLSSPASMPPTPLAGGPFGGDLASSVKHLEELRLRVTNLRQAVLQHPEANLWVLNEQTSVLAAPPQQLDDDLDERWWTPRRTLARAAPSKSSDVCAEFDSVCSEFDNVCSEFDKVLKCTFDTQPTSIELAAKVTGQREVPSVSLRSPSRRGSLTKQPTKTLVNKCRSPSDAENDEGQKRRKGHRLLGPKKGLAVHFGHENWNMVLSMMIGIRMSVGRSMQEVSRELQAVDFVMKEKLSIIPRIANIFDSAVSKKAKMTRFIDYAPLVFQRIRQIFGIRSEDYVRSVGPEQLLGNMILGNLASLSELSSEGKSGAFFYYTADGNYMMKTVAPKEQRLLKGMLKQYFEYITENPGTMLVRFLGLHCLRVKKSRIKGGSSGKDKKLYFVVMGNLFNSPFEIHRRYDLKGSWVGRFTKSSKFDPSVALKDVDFKEANEAIVVGKESSATLYRQVCNDSAFLCKNNIIDYSVLLGIHNISANMASNTAGADDDDKDSEAEHILTLEPDTNAPIHQQHSGGMLSTDKKALYFFGIIDILTPYTKGKVVEHHVKSLQHFSNRRGVSCCCPQAYAERFNGYMKEAFV